MFETLDGYCERLDASYWSEPVNALTNLAFIVAALIMWRRATGVPMGRVLSGVLFAIGVGSWLFHTHAQVWAAIADVTPIGLYILIYIFAINRDVVKLKTLWALGATLLFLPYAAITIPAFQNLPLYNVSAAYLPVPMLIVLYAIGFAQQKPEVARGFLIGVVVLMASLTFRSLDMPMCERYPLGTHFMWHVLNGIMLGWMIEVYLRARRSAS